MPYENENALVAAAVAGDRAALEELLGQVNDRIFTLALRMLGTVPDAEDATQDILLRIITNLRTFQGKSAFSTWATRIAIHYLYDYRKGMFAQHPLTFEMYGADTAQGFPVSDLGLCDGVDHHLLAEELKLSCTNVLLQCLKPEERVAYVLGTMFGVDSRLAGELLELTPEAYRQRLSRARAKVGGYLKQYCGLAGGPCQCEKRVPYAIKTHRLFPHDLPYTALQTVKQEMERLDDISALYESLYRSPVKEKAFLEKLLASHPMEAIQAGGKE